MSNIDRPKGRQGYQANTRHDCKQSSQCNVNWNDLGCYKLYELATVEERIEHFTKKKLCTCCGLKVDEKHFIPGQGRKWFKCPKPVQDVQCTENGCNHAAALCIKHQPNNASKVLLDWLKSKNIKSTVSTIVIHPASNLCCHDDSEAISPTTVKLSKKYLNYYLISKITLREMWRCNY